MSAHAYTPSEIDEHLVEAKRCKTFVDILNGNTPQVVAVTSDFLNGALNIGLSTSVRLGEIVEQQREEIARLHESYAKLLKEAV